MTFGPLLDCIETAANIIKIISKINHNNKRKAHLIRPLDSASALGESGSNLHYK